jgi:chromate transport protein ChrA
MRIQGLAIAVVVWVLIGYLTWLICRASKKLSNSVVGAWLGLVVAVVATAISEAVWGFPQVLKDRPSNWEDVVRAPLILLLYSAAMCFVPLMLFSVAGALIGFTIAIINSALRRK